MISAQRHTVTATPAVLLVAAGTDSATARDETLVRNLGTDPVYLGGADVTAAAGYTLKANEAVGLHLLTGDDLYAIADTGKTVEVATIHTRSEG